jgi:hypothetical protein
MSESNPLEDAIPRPFLRWIDIYSVALMFAALVAVAVAVVSLKLAIDGGFRGIFYHWCMGPVLVIPIVFAVRGLIARNSCCRLRRLWSILALLPLLSLSFLSLADSISSWRSNPVCDLAPLPRQRKYFHTRIEFQQDGNKSVVHDPYNKVRFCFGGAPEEMRVEGDWRIFVFHHGVILKTWVDDLEFGKEGIELGGWMGAGREHGVLQVSERGEFKDP